MTLPVNIPFTDRGGLIDYRWLRYLQSLASTTGSAPDTTEAVTDGSAVTYAPMTLFQGADSQKGFADTGSVYLALDTRTVYVAVGGTWQRMNEAISGDVIRVAGSTMATLADVFFSPGTYGSATQTPVLTIDSKGRITNISFEDIASGGSSAPAGLNGQLQFNSAGVFGGTAQITYNPATGGFVFADPTPTREALSPLTTKGDIYVRSVTGSTRLPVGANNEYLIANPVSATGLQWVADRTIDREFTYDVVSVFPVVMVPAGVYVKRVTTYIDQAFTGTGAVLSIGDAGDNQRLQANIDPYTAVGYQSTPGYKYLTDTQVNLYINPGTSTQGSGLISIDLERR